MIALSPFLYGPRTSESKPESDSGLVTVTGCYGAALTAFGKGAAQDGSQHGIQLEQVLAGLARRITSKPESDRVRETSRQVLSQIEQWGGAVAAAAKARADEIKELLAAVTNTAESIGTHDKAHIAEFHQLTGSLENLADLNDLTQIKASLLKNVIELKNKVEQLARDNQQLISQLKAQVNVYETRLKSAEFTAFRDELTGIPNRRYLEHQIAVRIRANEPFCFVTIDLNNFKPINDRHGHSAGDDLLRKFSAELKLRTRASDIVGRWGGDEFVSIMMCTAADASAYIDRIKYWVFGKYLLNLQPDGTGVEVFVDAAIGVAEWQPGMTAEELIATADANMYQEKRLSRKSRGGPEKP